MITFFFTTSDYFFFYLGKHQIQFFGIKIHVVRPDQRSSIFSDLLEDYQLS